MTISMITIERPVETGDIVFRGRFTAHDFVKLHLTPFDRALLDDISKSDATEADWLLGLEMLFRRAKEQGLM